MSDENVERITAANREKMETNPRCRNCMNWERPEPPSKDRGIGYCQIFNKNTSLNHGNQCTAFEPWPGWPVVRSVKTEPTHTVEALREALAALPKGLLEAERREA